MPAKQFLYFILTVPYADWQVPDELPEGIQWMYGQAEEGEGGYQHWQFIAYFVKKVTLTSAKSRFPDSSHLEPARSKAVEKYVRKEDTKIHGTEFELGAKALKRNSEKDWDQVWDDAVNGNMMSIPADIRIRSYHTLKRIRKDYETAPMREGITVNVFWGKTGTGKSHRMFEEAGEDAYIKSSTTKWWDGYRGQENVVIDEFRGQIAIEHMLKWCDKYKCLVEEKGGQIPLKATKIWIASNQNPRDWWKDLDEETYQAFRRRVTITEFTDAYNEVRAAHVAANVCNDINQFLADLFE